MGRNYKSPESRKHRWLTLSEQAGEVSTTRPRSPGLSILSQGQDPGPHVYILAAREAGTQSVWKILISSRGWTLILEVGNSQTIGRRFNCRAAKTNDKCSPHLPYLVWKQKA